MNIISVKDFLVKGEIIIDELQSNNESFLSYKQTLKLTILVFFVIFCIIKIHINLQSIFGIIMILFVVSVIADEIYSRYAPKGTVITSKKIIIFDRNYQPIFYPFDKIFGLSIIEKKPKEDDDNNVLRIFLEPIKSNLSKSRKYKDIRTSKSINSIYSEITKLWEINSPYSHIKKEINIAKNDFTNSKPIIGVIPWASKQVSSVVEDNADVMVYWNTKSIVQAIIDYSI